MAIGVLEWDIHRWEFHHGGVGSFCYPWVLTLDASLHLDVYNIRGPLGSFEMRREVRG